MEIISSKLVNMSDYGKITTCNVHCVHVKVGDISISVSEITKTISDTSWISRLEPIAQITFEATSKRTIEKLVNDILAKVNTTVTEEFGEYLISHSAQSALEQQHAHIKVPLSELWKEKVTGNPGFDFHSESSTNFIVFGEAKYSSSNTPRAEALEQIVEFINLKKDDADLLNLRHFVSEVAVTNYTSKKKAYVAAFSLNAQNVETIFKNALESQIINNFMGHQELYLIAIEI